MRALSSFMDFLYRAAGGIAGLSLILLCLLVLYGIAARLFGFYAGGATDLAGYAMATSTFMALAHTFRSNGHIRVQPLLQRLTGPARSKIELCCLALMSAITGFIAWHMVRLAYDSYDFGERSEGADAIPLWIPQTPVAVGSVLLAMAVTHTFAQALFDGRTVDPGTADDEGSNEV